jgi:type III secretion system FlhB-like substrate exporter
MDVLQAAALRYPEGADAPFITAKAKGILAQRLTEIAAENGVPVIANADVSDVLTLYEIGECVPPETYTVLAEIFAFIKRMEEHHERN